MTSASPACDAKVAKIVGSFHLALGVRSCAFRVAPSHADINDARSLWNSALCEPQGT